MHLETDHSLRSRCENPYSSSGFLFTSTSFKRGQTKESDMSSTKIAAVTRQKVDGKTLHTFIIKANEGLRSPYEVILFAKPDDNLQNILTVASRPGDFDFVEPLSKIFSLTQPLYRVELGTDNKGRPLVADKDLAIVQLFEPIASTHQQSFICVETNDSDTAHHEKTVGFQCKFHHVGAAVAALNDLTALYTPIQRAKILRNEAVRCGGVWDADSLARLRAGEAANQALLCAHLDMLTYPPFVGTAAKSNKPSLLTPVFIVSEQVSLDTLNAFLQAVDRKQDVRADQSNRDRYSVVVDASPTAEASTAGPATAPLSALPAIPKALMHAAPEACIAYARSRFPAQRGGGSMGGGRGAGRGVRVTGDGHPLWVGQW
ncbi:hypothetical protein MCOR25_004901 [Pyricularia grisea]|nr:hypothetical protein MCOR25_004901 [Pyricularia grisea]